MLYLQKGATVGALLLVLGTAGVVGARLHDVGVSFSEALSHAKLVYEACDLCTAVGRGERAPYNHFHALELPRCDRT
jgi:hypothetical protein